MIEKITNKNQITRHKLAEKNNELVDAINKLQLAIDVAFNRIDMLNNAICDIRNRITALNDPTYREAKPELSVPQCISDKINELVDAVNKHQDIIRQIGEWGSEKGECLWCDTLTEFNPEKPQDRMIGCTTLDIPKTYKVDSYAEQKWIGCLCELWTGNSKNHRYGILKGIAKNTYKGHETIYKYQALSMSFEHCEPVKPDSEIIYKGGNNE